MLVSFGVFAAKDMLIRKLASHIASQRPPAHEVWDAKSIGTAIMEICNYDIQQHKWLLKESFCFFLTKAERRSLGYKRGILKEGASRGATDSASDKDAARRAIRNLTLPSHRAHSTIGDNRLHDASSRADESTSTLSLERPPTTDKSSARELGRIVRCLYRDDDPLGLDFTRTGDGDTLAISSIAAGSPSASMPEVRVGLVLHEIQGRTVEKRSRAEQQLKELRQLAKTRPLALAFRVP